MPMTIRLKMENRLQVYDIDRPTTIHKIFEINSSFHVKWRTMGKVLFLFFMRFLLVMTKFLFWWEN